MALLPAFNQTAKRNRFFSCYNEPMIEKGWGIKKYEANHTGDFHTFIKCRQRAARVITCASGQQAS